jgi:hypothetical protein
MSSADACREICASVGSACCCDPPYFFSLATCYAEPNGRSRPQPDVRGALYFRRNLDANVNAKVHWRTVPIFGFGRTGLIGEPYQIDEHTWACPGSLVEFK